VKSAGNSKASSAVIERSIFFLAAVYSSSGLPQPSPNHQVVVTVDSWEEGGRSNRRHPVTGCMPMKRRCYLGVQTLSQNADCTSVSRCRLFYTQA
jgi:hypothetical protein